jgi:probable rRNA maturation factor
MAADGTCDLESATGLTVRMNVASGDWPGIEALARLVEGAVTGTFDELGLRRPAGSELGVLFVDDVRMRALNRQWRGFDKSTNVLSFPAAGAVAIEALPPLLGDIVLAAGTVAREARLENLPLEHHLLHLIVHGLLHLLGYDHENDEEADRMEGAESRILARLGVPDPHARNSDD